MYDLIVIGGGMAGMTSAIYALRENKKVLILEREAIGGQITQSPKVQNYPSFTEISGTELSDKTFEQVSLLGADFEVENVENVEKNDNVFVVKTDYNTYKSKAVVVATGLKHRTLGIENEESFVGRGIYYCAICDGPFFAGKDVCVIGGGNSALQYAIMLSSYCKNVHMFVRSGLTGEKALIEKVQKTPNIKIEFNVSAVALHGDETLENVVFKRKDGTDLKVTTNAVFVAVGQVPCNQIFSNLVELDKFGFIVSNEECTTNCEGLFVAGDCRTKTVRQVATAVGDGAIAGTAACRYIDINEGKLWKF